MVEISFYIIDVLNASTKFIRNDTFPHPSFFPAVDLLFQYLFVYVLISARWGFGGSAPL